MRSVHVNLGRRSYEILIGSGILKSAPQLLEARGIGRRLFLVSNTRVFDLFGHRLVQHLAEQSYNVTHILIPDGEKFKNFETVENIYTYLIAQQADRSSTILALGGGVTGDVAGFVAATFVRGISYIQIPTTLLAQVDSSVGGKTGVNHRLGKNLIGAFYQPHLVCVDIETLNTLPDREFQSGLYEVLKYGLIYDPEFFEFFEEAFDQIKARQGHILEEVISRCCEIKAEVIAIDETESNLRRILNFGHTLGHALETAADYHTFTHGEAISYGMRAALILSQRLEYLNSETAHRIVRMIQRMGPVPAVTEVPVDLVMEAMRRDKKRRDERSTFVLLKQIGRTVIRDDLNEDLIRQAWEQTIRGE